MARDIVKQQSQFKENEIKDLITQLILSGDILQHVQQRPSNGYAVTYLPYRERIAPQTPEMLMFNPLVKGLVKKLKRLSEISIEIAVHDRRAMIKEALAPFKEIK